MKKKAVPYLMNNKKNSLFWLLKKAKHTAMLCDKTGRHLVMMPHIERSTFQWNQAYYPKERND